MRTCHQLALETWKTEVSPRSLMYIMSRRFDNTWAVRKLKAKQSKLKSNGIILSKIKIANIENPLSVFETEPWIISWICSQNYLLNQICLSKIKFLSTIMTLCKYDHCVTCNIKFYFCPNYETTALVKYNLKIRKFAVSREWYCRLI